MSDMVLDEEMVCNHEHAISMLLLNTAWTRIELLTYPLYVATNNNNVIGYFVGVECDDPYAIRRVDKDEFDFWVAENNITFPLSKDNKVLWTLRWD